MHQIVSRPYFLSIFFLTSDNHLRCFSMSSFLGQAQTDQIYRIRISWPQHIDSSQVGNVTLEEREHFRVFQFWAGQRYEDRIVHRGIFQA